MSGASGVTHSIPDSLYEAGGSHTRGTFSVLVWVGAVWGKLGLMVPCLFVSEPQSILTSFFAVF